MSLKLNRLSPKFIDNVDRPGRYADGGMLYLEVGPGGKAKSYVFIYDRKRFGRKTPGNIGLGSARTVALGDARTARDIYRDQIRNGIDPLAKLKTDRQQRALGDAENMTFKAVADDFIEKKSKRSATPWRPRTQKVALGIVNTHLKPLHHMRPADIKPADIFNIVNPLLIGDEKEPAKPSMARAVLVRAQSIFEWANAHEAMEGKANPASMKGPLRILFGADSITIENEPRNALDWNKLPALMAKLDQFKPRAYYTVSEAARAIGMSPGAIYSAIYSGKLKTINARIIPDSWQEHQIDPAELFKIWPKLGHITPGLPPVSIYLLKFLILNGSRFDEPHYMRWSEWQREENLWVIPWQRVKGRNAAGRKPIRINHVIPLSRQSIEILTLLDEQKKLDQSDSEFVFGHYRSFFGTGVLMGNPPSDTTVRNLLRRLVKPEDVLSTLHGMRTAFRSWGGAQRRGGLPRFAESDLERAIAHVKGHGETAVSRLYSRQNSVAPLIPIFQNWADFCFGCGDDPAKSRLFSDRSNCGRAAKLAAKSIPNSKGQTWVTLAAEKKAKRAKKVETPEAPEAPEAPKVPANGHSPRAGTKYEVILGMLQRDEGASTREILEATGWPSISMPATAKALKIELRVERGLDQESNRMVNRYHAD